MKVTKNIQSNDEKENIVVWLDFDGYAYLNFGILIELAKLNKFNFIGIVATKQDISFFQNQKIIPFKKIIYYPNCYINKQNYNLENLRRYEKKFKLNLSMNIFSERSFYKYWIDFHRFKKEEIYSIIENSILFFINVLDEYKPKLILTQQIGENISNLLLYQIAKNLDFKILMPVPVHMHDKMIISDNPTGDEISIEFKKLVKNFTNSLKNYDENFLKKQRLDQTLKIQLEFTHVKRNLFQKCNYYIKRLSNSPEPIYKNIGKTKFNLIKYRFQNFFRIRSRKKFVDNNALKYVKNEKFLYFPLQTEPEARILITIPFYTNQITVIENIAKSIPIDYVLYVKEHPAQKSKLWRPIEDYKKIISIPNVRFIHPDFNAQELISKADGLITALGDTGFEGLFYKKPIFIFGKDHYKDLSNVTKINSFPELYEKIKNTLDNFEFNNKEMNVMMQAIENQTISIPYYSLLKDGVMISSIQRYENNFDLTIEHFEKYFENYKQYFKLIANTIYSKI